MFPKTTNVYASRDITAFFIARADIIFINNIGSYWYQLRLKVLVLVLLKKK